MASETVSEIPCQMCGGEVVEFSVPNRVWNMIMRPDGKETDQEYICLKCWHRTLDVELSGMRLVPDVPAEPDYRALAERLADVVKFCDMYQNEPCILRAKSALAQGEDHANT